MPVDHSKNIIEVSNVSFSYTYEAVLDHVSLNVHMGDYLGIVGPNGGGKTTLLKLILGLLQPMSGSIKLFGVPLPQFSAWSKIGYVPQKATNFERNFPATVREIVGMGRFGRLRPFQGLSKQDTSAISKALHEVEIENLADRTITDLSGGQQQRVFIARALAGEPEVIFLDEPTVGVDESVQREFYTLLKKLNQSLGLTLVLISHDIDTIVRETTEVACVNKTLFYESNPHEMKLHTRLQEMYGSHVDLIGHTHT